VHFDIKGGLAYLEGKGGLKEVGGVKNWQAKKRRVLQKTEIWQPYVQRAWTTEHYVTMTTAQERLPIRAYCSIHSHSHEADTYVA
jgi:hypothetical protein